MIRPRMPFMLQDCGRLIAAPTGSGYRQTSYITHIALKQNSYSTSPRSVSALTPRKDRTTSAALERS